MVPEKYLIPAAIILAALFAATLGMQHMRKAARRLRNNPEYNHQRVNGSRAVFFQQSELLLSDVGGATYKQTI